MQFFYTFLRDMRDKIGLFFVSIFVVGVCLSACEVSPTSETHPQQNPSTHTSLSVQADTLNEEWAVEWWLPRHTKKIEDKHKQPVDLIFIGDSITHGWEQEGAVVWDKFFGPRNGFNLGFGGDRTENVLWRLKNGAVEGLSPKLVVLMIGTNNTGHRMDTVDDTVAGIDVILRELAVELPETNILLLGIFPRGAKPDDPMRQRNKDINIRLADKTEQNAWQNKNVYYRDISNVFMGESGVISESIMPDLLHLSPKGYHRWADAIDADVTRLMAHNARN